MVEQKTKASTYSILQRDSRRLRTFYDTYWLSRHINGGGHLRWRQTYRRVKHEKEIGEQMEKNYHQGRNVEEVPEKTGGNSEKKRKCSHLRAVQISERGSALGCANAQHELSCIDLP